MTERWVEYTEPGGATEHINMSLIVRVYSGFMTSAQGDEEVGTILEAASVATRGNTHSRVNEPYRVCAQEDIAHFMPE